MHQSFEPAAASVLGFEFTTYRELPLPAMNDFVGVYMHLGQDAPTIFLPHGFPPVKQRSVDELRSDLRIFFRSLQRSKKALEGKGRAVTQCSTHYGGMFDGCVRVVEDYLIHGKILESESQLRTSGGGRTDWARTLRKQKPFFTEQGCVYLEPIKQQNLRSEQRLSEIQNYCLTVADNLVGWMFNRKPKGSQHLAMSELIDAIEFLERKLQSTYNNRLTTLLNDFLIILDEQRLQQGKAFHRPLGLKNGMKDVWEEMVESLFGNVSNGRFKPRAERIFPDKTLKISSDLRPDTVRLITNESGTIGWVIDAKYYHKGAEPGTSDINKQITYGNWVATEIKGLKPTLYNLFILPAYLEGRDFEYHGYATMGPLEDKSKPHHKVHFYKVNTISLMQSYLNNDPKIRDGICYDVSLRG